MSKAIKGMALIIGLPLLGCIGNMAIKPSESSLLFPYVKSEQDYVTNTLSGKKQIIYAHQKEIEQTQALLTNIQSERDRLYSEKISRGEMDKVEQLNKQKVINAIANNLGGVFAGKARYIYAICKGYEVNPMLLVAIMKHETGNGTSKAVKTLNNPGGIMLSGSKLKKFVTLENGIEAMARLLKDFYIDQGRCDIKSIGAKYCPVGAKNDPTGLNRHWVPAVTSNYNKIYKEVQ